MEKDENGQPRDRGAADFWYHRRPQPHYWPSGTGKGLKAEEADMTAEQITEYHEGYAEALARGDQKNYG